MNSRLQGGGCTVCMGGCERVVCMRGCERDACMRGCERGVYERV
jgi:hypothetical protein